MAWHAVIDKPKVSPDVLHVLAYASQPPTRTGRYICEYCNNTVDTVDLWHVCRDCREQDNG